MDLKMEREENLRVHMKDESYPLVLSGPDLPNEASFSCYLSLSLSLSLSKCCALTACFN